MRLKAGCDMTMEAGETTPLVAMLRPRSGEAQWVHSESYLLEPHVAAVEYVDSFGNLCQRFIAPKGKMRVRVELVVETSEHIRVDPDAPFTSVAELPNEALQFLLPSRFCPSDKLDALAHEVVKGKAPGYPQVEAICAWIHDNIEYRYGVSSATTDAAETVKERAGVCRDFSHVGLSLCRALVIPARMVVGFLHGLDPMDMHAWFEAFIGGRWYSFDATQKEPKGGRIVVAYGRDAADVALLTQYGPLEMKNMKVWVERT